MKKFLISVAAATMCFGYINAATDNAPMMRYVQVTNDDVTDKPDVLPEFPGGMDALGNFLRTNIKYPAEALKSQTEGKVIVEFIVTKNGTLKDCKVISTTPGVLNQEALRVMKKMPRWKPGKLGGRIVNVRFTLPVDFKLQ